MTENSPRNDINSDLDLKTDNNIDVSTTNSDINNLEAVAEFRKQNISDYQQEITSIVAEISSIQKSYNELRIKYFEFSKVVAQLKQNNSSSNLVDEANHKLLFQKSQLNKTLETYKLKVKLRNELYEKLKKETNELQLISAEISQLKPAENSEQLIDDETTNSNNNDSQNVTISATLESNYKILNKKSLKKTIVTILFFLPTIIVLFYCLFIYDNMYISKSTFTIKSNNSEAMTDLSAVGILNGNKNKDIYVAAAYIKSLDLFYDIDKDLNLIEHYSSHDIFSSLPNNPTQSEIEDYWNSILTVKIDSESDILEFTIRSYEPEFSQKIVASVLKKLEQLVNSMNAKALQDSIKLAQYEVDNAQEKLQIIADKIRVFRNENTFIDPKVEASNLLTIISGLESTITETRAELSQKLTYLREDSLEIVALKRKINSLEKELINIRKRLATPNNNNDKNKSNENYTDIQNILSQSLSDYEKLNAEYAFAQKLLESALSSLEKTKQISLSKAKYLVTIDAPKVPNESLWPKPFVAAIITLITTLFLISAVSLLLSAIKEHLGI